MPKRVIDFDAMWGSDKIASCAEWAQAEYAWLYGLADPSGCFELTNLRVIWGRVAAIRRNLTIERLEQVFGEFQDKGLLFTWEQDGKRYGYWTGSDVPGRLPPPSWRMRLERLAPAVPKQQLAEYMSRFARGRAASPGGKFRIAARKEDESYEAEVFDEKAGAGRGTARADAMRGGGGGLKGGVEEAHAQDLNLGLDWEGNRKGMGCAIARWRNIRCVGKWTLLKPTSQDCDLKTNQVQRQVQIQIPFYVQMPRQTQIATAGR
jgi:hypothetical protein